jgi:hypothetical protein
MVNKKTLLSFHQARDTVAFHEWEIRQLDELLESLTTLELDSRRRSKKMHDNYEVLRGAVRFKLTEFL